MKLKKILPVCILTILLLATPNKAIALTEAEMYAKLDELPFEKIDGKIIYKPKMIDPDILTEGICDKDNDDIYACKHYPYQDLLSVYLKSQGFETIGSEEEGFYYTSFSENEKLDKNKATIRYQDKEYNSVSYDVEIEYLTDVNQDELKKVKDIVESFKQEDYLYGLQLINLLYHYGSMYDATNTTEGILARYQSFKEVMELNPEYEYIVNGTRGGGPMAEMGRNLQVGVFKDGIMYGYKFANHMEHQILFVDKNASGTLEEKAEAKLNEYFNNTAEIDVQLDGLYTDLDDNGDISRVANKILGTKDIKYIGYFANITINDQKINFIISEAPKKHLDKITVKSHDKKTGVNVKTDSYDVPLDAKIKVKDVKKEKYVKNAFDKEKLIVELAFDLSLNKTLDGSIINKIDKGIEVYFPIDNKHQEGTKKKVYYIKDDGTFGEIIDGEIVKVDNKKYVKFKTNHFSTYAIASSTVENPQTLDNIASYIIIAFVSLVAIAITSIFLKKNKTLDK